MGRLSSNELLIFGGEGFGDSVHDDLYNIKIETVATGELMYTAKRLKYVFNRFDVLKGHSLQLN